MNNAFIVKDGQVFINQRYVEDTTVDYPVFLASENYEWTLFKDGHLEIRDKDGRLRVKTFTNYSI